MIIGIIKERKASEARVAATPESVKKLIGLGLEVHVEKGAGLSANIADDAFESAGAKLVAKADDVLKKSDVVFKVNFPLTKNDPEKVDEVSALKKGATVIALMEPFDRPEQVKALADKGVNAVALEWVPRITRAQSMDVLSSQTNLAGYRAVLEAAHAYGRAFPMMMTAAGTVAPAKIMVMGAGVAGLQAIATAKRLGAVVCATDVRMAAKEQVQSLGASFVMVDDEEAKAAETSGGYAKEMSDAYKKKQAELIAETLKKQDIAITTALIPGRPAPKLITKEMVASMKAGSVILDMAAPRGGNCELSKPGEVVKTDNGVTILAPLNLPSALAADASKLFAKNIWTLFDLLFDSDKKALNFNFDDEIIKGSVLSYGGKVVHERLGGDSKPAAKKAPAKKTATKKPATKKAAKSGTAKKATKKDDKKSSSKKTAAKKTVVKKAAPKKKTASKKAAPSTKKATDKK